MPRLPFLFVVSLLSTCVCVTGQIPRPSLTCPGMLLGKVPVSLTLIQEDPNNPTVLLPGVPLRVLVSVNGGDPNAFTSAPFLVGTYPAIEQCSLTTTTFTTTFNIPIAVTITSGGNPPLYIVSVSAFIGSFYLGAPGTLTLNLPGGTRGERPILFTTSEIISSGTLLLSPTPSPTPLPPSIILPLTGLVGAGLLTLRRWPPRK